METISEYFSNLWGSVQVAAVLWIILYLSMRRDRSRYRNCYFFFAAALFSLPVITSLAGPFGGEASFLLALVILILILVVPVLLILNGIQMLRKEGHSLANMLSLVLGIALAAVEIIVFLFVGAITLQATGKLNFSGIPYPLFMILLVIMLTILYFSGSFLIFMLYTLFLEVIPRKRDFDYVVILGAGLLHGDRISKLLSDRLDKAIEIYKKDPTPPMMIPSGGQGSDETISEGEAMAKYLIAHGIPKENIIAETKSTDTFENIKFSKAIIDARESGAVTIGGDETSGLTGDAKKGKDSKEKSCYIAVVTSNYHVYRALRYWRGMENKLTGIGAHVASYYWPSALIREYIAIHSERKHALIFVVGWFILVGLPVWLLW